MTAQTPAEQAAQVLADHSVTPGPISGSWSCPCGATSNNGTIRAGDLTSQADRAAQLRAHIAQALADAGLLHDPDALNRDEGEAVTFGLMHPTWRKPQCFFYATETDAWDAITRTYGADASHVVVRRVLNHINRADHIEAEADR